MCQLSENKKPFKFKGLSRCENYCFVHFARLPAGCTAFCAVITGEPGIERGKGGPIAGELIPKPYCL
jgi:hypothetical protein